MLRKLKWQIPGESFAARYNWYQGPVPGRGPAVEKHHPRLYGCCVRLTGKWWIRKDLEGRCTGPIAVLCRYWSGGQIRCQNRNTMGAAVSSAVNNIYIYMYYLLLVVFSPRASLAGTRAQSRDRYGSGTLHPGQVLRGSLPLISPAFRRSHFCRQVPPRPQRRERS
jgi:hypothetical protein